MRYYKYPTEEELSDQWAKTKVQLDKLEGVLKALRTAKPSAPLNTEIGEKVEQSPLTEADFRKARDKFYEEEAQQWKPKIYNMDDCVTITLAEYDALREKAWKYEDLQR